MIFCDSYVCGRCWTRWRSITHVRPAPACNTLNNKIYSHESIKTCLILGVSKQSSSKAGKIKQRKNKKQNRKAEIKEIIGQNEQSGPFFLAVNDYMYCGYAICASCLVSYIILYFIFNYMTAFSI